MLEQAGPSSGPGAGSNFTQYAAEGEEDGGGRVWDHRSCFRLHDDNTGGVAGWLQLGLKFTPWPWELLAGAERAAAIEAATVTVTLATADSAICQGTLLSLWWVFQAMGEGASSLTAPPHGQVTFEQEGRLGINFSFPIIESIAVGAVGGLAEAHPELIPGMLLASVAGHDVIGLSQAEAFDYASKAGRPLTLQFRRVPWYRPPPPPEPELEPEPEPEPAGVHTAADGLPPSVCSYNPDRDGALILTVNAPAAVELAVAAGAVIVTPHGGAVPRFASTRVGCPDSSFTCYILYRGVCRSSLGYISTGTPTRRSSSRNSH